VAKETSMTTDRLQAARAVSGLLRTNPDFRRFVSTETEGTGSIVVVIPSDTVAYMIGLVNRASHSRAVVCLHREEDHRIWALICSLAPSVGALEQVVKVAPFATVGVLVEYLQIVGEARLHLEEPDFRVTRGPDLPDSASTTSA
jgi:hypothetical protein